MKRKFAAPALALTAASMTFFTWACSARMEGPPANYMNLRNEKFNDRQLVLSDSNGFTDASSAIQKEFEPANSLIATATPAMAGGRGAIQESKNELWIIPVASNAAAPGYPAPLPAAVLSTKLQSNSIPLPTSPMLAARDPSGNLTPLPFAKTDISASITGPIASVDLTQRFANPYPRPIEALYIFPLPQTAAVTDFVMTLGDRHIRGIIRQSDQAQQIYTRAKNQGYNVSLLKQQADHLFIHHLANLEPQKPIDIQIHYFHTLTYQDGWFEWVFPLAANPDRSAALAALLPTISAQKPAISLQVRLNAGMPIENLLSVNHKIQVDTQGPQTTIHLAADSAVDKDFILRFKPAGEKPLAALFNHKSPDGGGYFALLLFPLAGHPSITGLHIDFAGTQTAEIYPRQIPDRCTSPLLITGRYAGTPSGNITITADGFFASLPISQAVEGDPAIASIWARTKIAALTDDLLKAPSPASRDDAIRQITQTALTHSLVTNFTSLIAVDSTRQTNDDGPPAPGR